MGQLVVTLYVNWASWRDGLQLETQAVIAIVEGTGDHPCEYIDRWSCNCVTETTGATLWAWYDCVGRSYLYMIENINLYDENQLSPLVEPKRHRYR